MEFPFDIYQLLRTREEIVYIDADIIEEKHINKTQLGQILNSLGRSSAIAQGLPAQITDLERIIINRHRLYLAVANNTTISGFLKVGEKHLSLYDKTASIHMLDVTCVLDFYVSEKVQRQGIGNKIFSFFLEKEKIEPALIAYDRPSPKLRSFLEKHYKLTRGIDQPNSYLVFDGMFTINDECRSKKVLHEVCFSPNSIGKVVRTQLSPKRDDSGRL